MKKFAVVIIVVVIILSLLGCNKNETTQTTEDTDENETSQTTKSTDVNETTQTAIDSEGVDLATEDTAQIDLITMSEEFSVQMANNEFGNVTEKFSNTMKAQIDESTLKQVWEATVAEMGNYLKVYESTEKTADTNQEVDVVLRYENNGLLIKFIYNKSGKLEGLWFNYFPLKEDNAINELFEELDITIGEDPYPVEGVLTLPKDIKNPPVVILVQGSGTHDMDETIGASANKPFRDIAWGLAEQGIASIRYNERFFQYPELGAYVTTIEEDLLTDASEAVKYAAACDKIDTGKIFVLGHSLGGMLAPKIAFDHKEVAGIICLAGSPRKLEDIVYDQQMFLMERTAGISKLQKSAAVLQLNLLSKTIKNLKGTETEVLLGYPATYWFSLNQIDIPEISAALTIPMLISQGSEDWQVYKDKDYKEWQELLRDNKNVTFQLYDNLNHLFMASNGRTDITEYNIKAKVDQQVINDVAAWIKLK